MDIKNYSVEVTVCENGKYSKGTLTLFIDEYVFGKTRTTVDWEKVTCEKGMTKVKAFLFSSEKPYVVFKYNGTESQQFILEQVNMDTLLSKIEGYANHIKTEREEKLAKERKIAEEKRKAEEERIAQEEKENQIREDAKRKAEEEFRQKKEQEERLKKEKERKEKELFDRKKTEKNARIQKEVENCKNNLEQPISVDANIKKVASCFLDNPYRVLGVSCTASNEDANQTLDKLKKLARLKALESYKSPFDLASVERPVRDLSIAQNALAMLKDKNHKWFWFSEADACYAWYSGKYRIELSKDGQEFGTYDLFLANYMYAVLCDSKFETAETWKRVLSFYCFICEQKSGEILNSRFSAKDLDGKSQKELLAEFKKIIFTPLLQLCDTDDLMATLRLNKYIKDCNNKLLDELSRTVLEKVAYWFKSKETDAFEFLGEFDEENITTQQQKEIRERGDRYCQTVERVFEPVLKELRGELTRYEMIRESYRTTTYQFMYVLHKCADKSDAIYFANKTYTYCKEDDRQRIKNTFGEANIKFIDWNIPHTGWDIKGDEYYFGKGCEVDYTQAVYWYHKAADEGNMYSQNSLGLCYQKGTGVPQSDEQAVSWFEKAYESGSPDGAYNLAECYFEGNGVKKSIDKALEMWAAAAKLGHPSAGAKRQMVFSDVKSKRKAHRAKNHICHDIGFQMPIGSYSGYIPDFDFIIPEETLRAEAKVDLTERMEIVDKKIQQSEVSIQRLKEQGVDVSDLEEELEQVKSGYGEAYGKVESDEAGVNSYVEQFYDVESRIINEERKRQQKEDNSKNDEMVKTAIEQVSDWGDDEAKATMTELEEAYRFADNSDEKTFIANKMSNLGFETMTTNYNWLRAFFSNVLCKPETKYTNAQKAEYWKSQAYLAMDSQNTVQLRKAVFELLDIMTSSSNQAISTFGADLTM